MTISGGVIALDPGGEAYSLFGLPESVITGVVIDRVAVEGGTPVTGACANVEGMCTPGTPCPACL